MRGAPPEQLLLLLVVFLLALLLNVLLGLWRRRQRDSARGGAPESVPHQGSAQATRPPSVEAARIPGHGHRLRREAPGGSAEPSPGSRRRTAPPRLGLPDVRRAVVLMAILGPCRALEPWQPPVLDARDSGSPPPVA
jgi:hypothetical protein